MRIGIDARSLHYEGVGRYIRELLRYIAAHDHQNEFVLYFSSEQNRKEYGIDQANFRNTLLPVSLYDIHRQLYLRSRLAKDRLDVFHATDHWLVPFFPPCRVVVTVHDTFVKTVGRILPLKVLLYGRIVLRRALAVAARIISISNFESGEIIAYCPEAARKISVIYHGIAGEFAPVDKGVIARVTGKYGIAGKYLLFVGSLKKHKNIPRLIEAFSRLSADTRSGTDLVIAARVEPRFADILKLPERFGVEKQCRIIGYVPNVDLPGLYCGAEALILPSLTEYFGFTTIEAMACGVPVIASSRGSIPEVGGEAARYFEPESVGSISRAIADILSNKDLQKKMAAAGLERAREFSWDTTARKTLELYKELCNNKAKLPQRAVN